MKKALIFNKDNNNRIFETHITGFDVAPPLNWIDCPDEVTTEYTYENGQFIPPKSSFDIEESRKEFLATRNILLKNSDWTQLPDTNPPGGKEAWIIYRQALRDLPETYYDINSVIWPTSPS